MADWLTAEIKGGENCVCLLLLAPVTAGSAGRHHYIVVAAWNYLRAQAVRMKQEGVKQC
jgi:hypothetical protein